MNSVRPSTLPASALLIAYGSESGYADCFVASVSGAASFESFVEAFYTTPLFKVERTLIRWLASRPSSDQGARDLSRGACRTFAAWKVESRAANQLLLADYTGRTRSWLMAEPFEGPPGNVGTRLYFGSAIVPRKDSKTGRARMGFAFHALLGFHNLYSRLLLGAACKRLQTRS